MRHGVSLTFDARLSCVFGWMTCLLFGCFFFDTSDLSETFFFTISSIAISMYADADVHHVVMKCLFDMRVSVAWCLRTSGFHACT
jgi:hypothetical protein